MRPITFCYISRSRFDRVRRFGLIVLYYKYVVLSITNMWYLYTFFNLFSLSAFCTKTGRAAVDRIRTRCDGRPEPDRGPGTRTTSGAVQKGRGNPSQLRQEQKRPLQNDPKFAVFTYYVQIVQTRKRPICRHFSDRLRVCT